jgi:mono/diheme cytochrome c family protein
MSKHKFLIRFIIVWILAGALVFGITYLAQAAPHQQTAAEGEAIFKQQCAACHTIGGGRLVGPDLEGVADRRDVVWLKAFIATPDKVLAAGDPIATQLLAEYNNVPMPNLGLAQAEVDALVAYLESGGAVAAAPVVAAGAGDPQRGMQLFTGKQALLNGGTNCIACHSTADAASLGGGTLGPELTYVLQRYGEPGLASALNSLPFPTMQGIFTASPLTAEEQADLLAYFIQTNQISTPTANLTHWFWIGGGIGALVFFALMAIFWPRQRQSLSDRLRKQA